VFAGRPATYDRHTVTKRYRQADPDLTQLAYESAPSSFCPVLQIDQMHLAPGASLTEQCPVSLQSTTFDLALHEVHIRSTRFREKTQDEQTIDTAIELAKLAGWQTHPLARAVSADEETKQKRPSHIGWFRAFDGNLMFSLSRSGFDVFLDKVSSDDVLRIGRGLILHVLLAGADGANVP
jgi:hypothetical protein